jgi:hypothetical protein
MGIVSEQTKEYLKKEVDRMIKIPGNTRAGVLKAHADYIRFKEGEEGVRKVEEVMRELGHPINFAKINIYDWNPDGLPIGTALVAKEIFGWSGEDIFEMGKMTAGQSLLLKLILRYFVSPKKAFKEGHRLWEKYYDFGKLDMVELNEKEKYLILRVTRPKFHPLVCIYYRGYITRICQFVFGTNNVKVEETKCQFRGDPYHEYTIRWS